MKVVFMGTPDFAVPALKALCESDHEVCAVFTQPDKPKGRGYKLMPPPVKELAQSYSIPVFQPESLKRDPTAAVEILSEFCPDVIVVAAYGKILPKEVLELPRYGCINIHGSLLPKYRGAAPIQRAVLNGDKTAGVTTMQMAEGLDTGDILLMSETEIGQDETSAELFDRLSQLGAQLMLETLEKIDSITPVPQNESESCYAAMLSKDMCPIDFNKSAFEVHKHICGLSDWPCATTKLGGKLLKVYKSHIENTDKVLGQPGTIIDEKSFTVACKTGSVSFKVVQAEGSKRMNTADYLRGKPVTKGEILG